MVLTEYGGNSGQLETVMTSNQLYEAMLPGARPLVGPEEAGMLERLSGY